MRSPLNPMKSHQIPMKSLLSPHEITIFSGDLPSTSVTFNEVFLTSGAFGPKWKPGSPVAIESMVSFPSVLDIMGYSYWCLVGNGWEWGNGMMIDSYCGSFPKIPYEAPVSIVLDFL